jgi:hypothetical protein
MRASKRLMLLAIALWLGAVACHDLLFSSIRLRMALSPFGDAMAWLTRVASPCRLIIVGSSPAVFGLSAASLAKETGCRAVNLGLLNLHSLTSPYLVETLKHVRKGDIVVLVDRRWIDVPLDSDHCRDGPSVLCFGASLRVVPHLAEDLRVLGLLDDLRGPDGDLRKYPPLTGAIKPTPVRPLDEVPQRLQSLRRQAELIRAAGAWPVLAAAPMLVAEPSRSDQARALAAFDAEVRATLGEAVWVPALLETDPRLFSLEGQHSSAAGRDKWTAAVASALAAARAGSSPQ